MSADKVSELIDELVQNKTFNLDALDAIKALKDKALAQETKIVQLSATIDTRGNELLAQHTKIQDLENQIGAFKAIEANLTAREAKVRDLEKKEAVSTAIADTYKDVFGVIFKNPVVREANLRALPHEFTSHPNGGNTSKSYQVVKEEATRTVE